VKKVLVSLCLLLGASASFAQTTSNVVRWQSFAGVITSQNVDNPVSANIHSGTFAWTVRGGSARVNLATGAVSFNIQQLVINGAAVSGTPGPITAVTGTLVCNPGTTQESPHDTSAVSLDAHGNAQFSGNLGAQPGCANPLFLVRIFNPSGARGLWIATGVDRTFGE
jgi:hypothetical protein